MVQYSTVQITDTVRSSKEPANEQFEFLSISEDEDSNEVPTQCLVCNDHLSTGQATTSKSNNHAGACCCDSCRSFFKKYVLADKWHLLTCVKGNGECAVDAASNRQPNACRSCRFEKCLYVGMRVDSFAAPVDTSKKEENDPNLNVITLDKQQPIKTFKNLANGSSSKKSVSLHEDLGIVCSWCFKSLIKLEETDKTRHHETCPFRLKDMCMFCHRTLSNINVYNRKTHVEHCRNKHRLENTVFMTKIETPLSSRSKRKKTLVVTHDNSAEPSRRKSQRLKHKHNANDEIPDQSAEMDCQEVIHNVSSDEENENFDFLEEETESEFEETVKADKKSKKRNVLYKLSKCCKGYRPPFEFSNGETIYSNFPFQALDNDRDNIKFVIVNGVFHNHNCFRADFQLKPDAKNGANRLCNDLAYHKYLQNILRRGRIMTNFSAIPHQYLTYNQLKRELNHYRDSIKRLKLDNLNLRRTIDSLRGKDESYKKFIGMLAMNEYPKLGQLIQVCLNQKKGINGIIEKLIDSTDGGYQPRDKEITPSSSNSSQIQQQSNEDPICKICAERVLLVKMRDHISKHILSGEVEESGSRCGYCGLVGTCGLSIRISRDKRRATATADVPSWSESDCPYYRTFSVKMQIRSEKTSGRPVNHPVECAECSACIWSFNLVAHYREKHAEVETPPSYMDELEGTVGLRGDDTVSCKVCNEPCVVAKMRDHVARHILLGEISSSGEVCGFCGLTGQCTLQIVATSGKGKNTTYGPVSSCPYYRKFNLKSSSKPTKSSPSTNRPIECHLCKQVCWSYNVRGHFGEQHPEEPEPPELITTLERELVCRS